MATVALGRTERECVNRPFEDGGCLLRATKKHARIAKTRKHRWIGKEEDKGRTREIVLRNDCKIYAISIDYPWVILCA